MKILILGCNGYLGQRISLEARLRGYRVTGVDQHQENLAGVHDYLSRNLYPVHASTWESVKKLAEHSDFVINLIGLVGYKKCDDYPNLATTLNEDFPPMLANANVLHFSAADSIYGKQPQSIATITESTTPNPVSHYGKTKLEGECSLLQLNQRARVVRLSSVFGISPLMRWDVLIHDWIKTLSSHSYLEIFQPSAIRNFTQIDYILKILFEPSGYVNYLQDQPLIKNINNISVPKIALATAIRDEISPQKSLTVVNGEDPEHRNYVVGTDYVKSYIIDEALIRDSLGKTFREIQQRELIDFPSS